MGVAELPPDASRWQPMSRGFAYLDRPAAVDGIARVKLVGGNIDKARSTLSGNGAGLDVATPPFDLPITVQLVNGHSNVCWTASYDYDAGRRSLRWSGKLGEWSAPPMEICVDTPGGRNYRSASART